MAVVCRLWIACILSATLRGFEPPDVAKLFGLKNSDAEHLERRRHATATRASALFRFCGERQRAWERLAAHSEGPAGAPAQLQLPRAEGSGGECSWWMLETLFGRLKERLWWGVREELIPLLTPKTETMTIELAKALHKAGYRTLSMVAASEEKKLVQALRSGGRSRRGRSSGGASSRSGVSSTRPRARTAPRRLPSASVQPR